MKKPLKIDAPTNVLIYRPLFRKWFCLHDWIVTHIHRNAADGCLAPETNVWLICKKCYKKKQHSITGTLSDEQVNKMFNSEGVKE